MFPVSSYSVYTPEHGNYYRNNIYFVRVAWRKGAASKI